LLIPIQRRRIRANFFTTNFVKNDYASRRPVVGQWPTSWKFPRKDFVHQKRCIRLLADWIVAQKKLLRNCTQEYLSGTIPKKKSANTTEMENAGDFCKQLEIILAIARHHNKRERFTYILQSEYVGFFRINIKKA
jgi:hypothetical protein